jgi:hypothetical protein
MIDWTLAHFKLMWVFVGLTFMVMLFIPDARWNAITTVWGALFLGLLISLVLEQRGESIQLRVWLAQNTGRVRTTVDEVLALAVQSAALAMHVPEEIMQRLMSGVTRSARHEAAESARAYMWNRMQVAPVGEDSDHVPADDSLGCARQVRQLRESLPDLRHRNRLVLSRVTQLDAALDRLLDALRWYEDAVVAKDNPWGRDVRNTRYLLQTLGEAAVGLSEACADLLFEARLLAA